MQQVWARHVLACFSTIWQWRQGAADAETPWTRAVASSALRSRLLSALHPTATSIDPTRPDARGLRHLLTTWRRFIPASRTPPPAHAEHVLFFEGGSRGNPGPVGAGAVIIRTDRHRAAPQLVWSAAQSLAAITTTNNQAKFRGLITGLTAVARHNWRPLEVVGDSMLIARQLADYRPPKNAKLLLLYREPAASPTRSVSYAGTTTSAPTTRWLMLLPTSRWTVGAASSPSTRLLDPSGPGSTSISLATFSTGNPLPSAGC